MASYTNLAAGLQKTTSEVLQQSRGLRDGVQTIVIVVTDGVANLNVTDIPRESAILYDITDSVYVIGITEAIDEAEMEELAEGKATLFLAKTFEELDNTNIPPEIVASVCDKLEGKFPMGLFLKNTPSTK